MSKIYSKIRVYNPDKNGEQIHFKTIPELVKILKGWLLTDGIIEMAYGTSDIKYVMQRDRIADHLADGHMGHDFVSYGKKHQRARILLDHIADMN